MLTAAPPLQRMPQPRLASAAAQPHKVDCVRKMPITNVLQAVLSKRCFELFTSDLPLLYLTFTPAQLANLEPRFGNHSLRTLGIREHMVYLGGESLYHSPPSRIFGDDLSMPWPKSYLTGICLTILTRPALVEVSLAQIAATRPVSFSKRSFPILAQSAHFPESIGVSSCGRLK